MTAHTEDWINLKRHLSTCIPLFNYKKEDWFKRELSLCMYPQTFSSKVDGVFYFYMPKIDILIFGQIINHNLDHYLLLTLSSCFNFLQINRKIFKDDGTEVFCVSQLHFKIKKDPHSNMVTVKFNSGVKNYKSQMTIIPRFDILDMNGLEKYKDKYNCFSSSSSDLEPLFSLKCDSKMSWEELNNYFRRTEEETSINSDLASLLFWPYFPKTNDEIDASEKLKNSLNSEFKTSVFSENDDILFTGRSDLSKNVVLKFIDFAVSSFKDQNVSFRMTSLDNRSLEDYSDLEESHNFCDNDVHSRLERFWLKITIEKKHSLTRDLISRLKNLKTLLATDKNSECYKNSFHSDLIKGTFEVNSHTINLSTMERMTAACKSFFKDRYFKVYEEMNNFQL